MTTPPPTERLLERLRAATFFEELDAAVVAELAAHARWQEYAAGEVVVLEGEAPHGLFFLHEGWLKVVKTSAAGREQTLTFLQPGDTFNEIQVFASLPNPATAIALEPAGVWLIPREALLRLLRDRPEFTQQLIAKLARRMLHLVNLVTDLSLHTVTTRLARLLLEGAGADGVLPRPRWYTQAELAGRLGTVPDVVQRALRDLENENVIRVERHQIQILDREKLAALAA